MKNFLVLFVAVLLFGCSEQKVDTEKMKHAIALVNNGQYEEGIKSLDELGAKSPSDSTLKTARIQAHLKFAAYYLYNDTLSPKVKYPAALKEFRTVLKLDPNNADAKEQSQMIIDIYASMGREVPAEN